MKLESDTNLETAPRRPRSPWLARSAGGVGIALAIGLVIVNVQLNGDLHAAQARDDAGRAALQVAAVATQDLLSYNYRTIQKDLDRGAAWTTGSFKKELQTLDDKVVKPTALSKLVVTKTTVSDVAVVHQSPSTVELLVFAGQVTTSQGSQTQQNTSRITLTMKQVGGKWLVSALTPI